MRKIAWLALLGASMTAVLIVAAVRAVRGRHAMGDTPSLARDDDGVRSELEASRRELRQLQRTVADLATRPVTVAPPPVPGAPQAEHPQSAAELQAAMVAQQEKTERRYGYLQGVFESEAPDQSSTKGTRDRLLTGLAAPAYAGIKLESLECRASMCRASLTVAAGAKPQMLAHLVGTLPGISGGTLRRLPGPDGTTSVVTFLSREGHHLPQLASAP
jgi:hypothetical protein